MDRDGSGDGVRFGSLFSGIGGLDLGLEMAGMECSWMVEVDKFGSQILKHQWPEAEIYGDIYTIDGKELEPVDLICGGFPCQPVSLAGKRGGTSDERWLWGEFARIIRQVKPRWVVAENVTGLLSANSGRAFAEVLRDLAESGYDAVWNVFPAGGQGGVGAPHKRERIFIVAKRITNSNDKWVGRGKRCTLEKDRGNSNRVHPKMANTRCKHGEQGDTTKLEKEKTKRSSRTIHNQSSSKRQSNKMANTDREGSSSPFQRSSRSSGQQKSTSKVSRKSDAVADTDSTHSKGSRVSSRVQTKDSNINSRGSQKNVANSKRLGQQRQGTSRKWSCSETYGERQTDNAFTVGIEDQWSVEPDVGRVAHGIPNRVDRLKALGNAVVPQVAKQIGEMIMEIESV